MTHPVGNREQWLKARLELLRAEKELTRRSDELAHRRRELPWVRIDQDYHFDANPGKVSLTDLFCGCSQLLVYHFMFGPTWTQGCPSCSAIADGRFNFDFNVSFTEEEQRDGTIEYNYARGAHAMDQVQEPHPIVAAIAKGVGTDAATYGRDRPGMSAFIQQDGAVFHTYSSYARGLDPIWNMYQWLDRAPLGRNEQGIWWKRRDEYGADRAEGVA